MILVETLHEAIDTYFDNLYVTGIMDLEKLKKAIREDVHDVINEQPKIGAWTNANNAPKKTDGYLTYNGYGYGLHPYDKDRKKWDVDGITHWMPVPSVPEEEK